jgi:hypothetical protein
MQRVASISREEHSIRPTGQPIDGDIVIASVAEVAPSWSVEQVPHPPGLTVSTRAKAVALVRDFAKQHGLDIWYQNGQQFLALERFRPGDA